jgi:signal transduction histidine kinase
MARHGGTATVISAPGEGTKVTLTMPRSVTASHA